MFNPLVYRILNPYAAARGLFLRISYFVHYQIFFP